MPAPVVHRCNLVQRIGDTNTGHFVIFGEIAALIVHVTDGVLRCRVAAVCGFAYPVDGFGPGLGDAFAQQVFNAKVVLRTCFALLRGFAIPVNRFRQAFGEPLPSSYISPRLKAAAGSPCSAALRNQYAAWERLASMQCLVGNVHLDQTGHLCAHFARLGCTNRWPLAGLPVCLWKVMQQGKVVLRFGILLLGGLF